LPPGKLNVKTGLPLNLYFGLSILLVFSTLLLYVFFGLFSGDLGFSLAIHIRIHHHFSSFSERWLVDPV